MCAIVTWGLDVGGGGAKTQAAGADDLLLKGRPVEELPETLGGTGGSAQEQNTCR
jgi:hypothetical protein